MATEDFATATRRLLRAAELLQESPDPAIHAANHLLGLSAECALKATMQRLSGRRDAEIAREHKVHLPHVWLEYERFLAGAWARAYVVPPPERLISDWSIDQRYMDDSYLTEATHRAQLQEAQRIARLLDELRLDGFNMEAGA